MVSDTAVAPAPTVMVYVVDAANWVPAPSTTAPPPPPPACLSPPPPPPPTSSTTGVTAEGNTMVFVPLVAVNAKYCLVVPGTSEAVATVPPCVIVAAAGEKPTLAGQ